MPPTTTIIALAITALLLTTANATTNVIAYQIPNDFKVNADPDKPIWKSAPAAATIDTDWQGIRAYSNLATTVKSLWSDTHLYLLFTAKYDRIAVDRDLDFDEYGDCWHIWRHDVVEIFIGDHPDIRKYAEFVVSPIGQYIDIMHDKNLAKSLNNDAAWTSGWSVATDIDRAAKQYTVEFRIPFAALTSAPIGVGKTFRANLYRCADTGDNHKYLALNPTETPTPSFHIPEKFGNVILAQASLDLPKPVLHVDFDAARNPDWNTAEGLVGNQCLDMTRGDNDQPGRPFIIDDRRILDALTDCQSMTITGWFKCPYKPSEMRHQTVIYSPKQFGLSWHGRWTGLAFWNLYGLTAEDNRRVQTSWFGPFKAQEDRWTFFAWTYDGSKDTDNVGIYAGGEKDTDTVWLDTNKIGDQGFTIDPGKINQAPGKQLVIGANDPDGSECFDGYLDSIRIYAAQDDSSAALTQAQLDAVRIDDLHRARKTQPAPPQPTDPATTQYWSEPLNAVQVDSLDRTFPDIAPDPYHMPIHTPRGAELPLTFAVMSGGSASCKMTLSTLTGPGGLTLKTPAKLYYLQTVPVEANNNGGIRSGVGVEPPSTWMEYLIREAPFDLSEVMREGAEFQLTGGRYHTVLADLTIPADAQPGVYSGAITFESTFNIGGHQKTVPFQIVVHKTQLPEEPFLNVVHWLHPEPVNLTVEPLPQWWSEEHWRYLEIAGRQLRAYGNTSVFTPTIDGQHPLIQTTRQTDGAYTFDFTKFDRWVELFLSQGFRCIEGHHVKHRAGHVYILDQTDGKTKKLFTKEEAKDEENWWAWLPNFYKALHAHLTEKGWIDVYAQCQYDEPGGNLDNYTRYSDLARKYMPGVKTKDAIAYLKMFTDVVDIAVPSMTSLEPEVDVAIARQKKGQITWLYHCCSPYPPYPNRHLDEPLAASRLMPWLCHKLHAEGYLFWAANLYRGVDPYKGSLGPIGPGRKAPMHPTGDDWYYYPTPEGLIPGYRNVVFRDGLIDHTLLTTLAEQDPAAANDLVNHLVRNLLDWERTPAPYHAVRRQILKELDQKRIMVFRGV